MGFVIPYVGFSSSAWNVPNILSQMINEPAWFLSIYFGSRPWCTRWCEGVLKIYSNQPSLLIVSVWIQNWYSVLRADTYKKSSGTKPNTAIGRLNANVHTTWNELCLNATDRL